MENLEKILETQRKEYQGYLGVLGEQFESQVKLVAESLSDIQKQLIVIRETIAANREMIAKNAENIEIIKSDIQFIKQELKQKTDIDEFRTLEKRVMFLEKKLRAN